ncbi:ATP-binding cassette, subfamily B [Candidatus Electrothrix marina]|uniref:ATP-binding cassette, subfamily B n=1 Tax=Candidatus Electrothrix marina TaxID=1859130 RepID=A0A444J800_9BACT|nr:ATP-binding cassette, subfamily B [Candidatus Electrothrix marina]
MHNFGYFEEGRVGKVSDVRIWQRILSYCRPHKLGIFSSIFLSLLITCATLALPRLMQLGIDRYIAVADQDTAVRLAGLANLAFIYGGAVLLAFAAGFIQVVLLEYIGQSIMHRLRNDLYQHILGLDLAFFHRHPVGRLVTRLTNDIQNMHEMFTSVMVTLFNDLLKLVGILVVLSFINLRLAAVMALFLPLALTVTLFFSRLAREQFRAVRSQLAVVNSFLQENISAVNLVQLYGRELASRTRFNVLNHEFMQRTLAQVRLFGFFMPLSEFLSSLAMAVILWYGGSEVLKRQLTIGELVAFFSYMRLFFQPMRDLSQKYSIVQSALASAERIFQLLDTGSRIHSPEDPLCIDSVKGEIRFEQVGFSYQEDRGQDQGEGLEQSGASAPEPEQGDGEEGDEQDGQKEGQQDRQGVLRDIDLQIRAGETLALVGSTGAGKSTLISLLVRFYDPSQGRILLDGHDLRDFAVSDLRRKIGLVLQEVLIEPDTVLANIRLETGMDRAAVEAMLAETGMDAFIQRLPQGLDTRIGEGGLDLSSGEKQLLAFARILCRDPAVLILDEATSSVDTEAENLLEQAVEASFAGRTSIIIAHRLSTVRRADRIVVMDQGRIAEQGSHDELMAQGGLYANLIALDLQER